MPALPELISKFPWLLSNPIDLTGLRGTFGPGRLFLIRKEALHVLLSLLERHNVAATFFMSGVCAEQNKDEVLRITNAGHEMGLHGYRHIPYDMPWAENGKRHASGYFCVRELGVTVKGFRAPWLIANEDAYRAAQMHNLKYVSNVSAKKALQRLDKYSLVELPIYLNDQVLLQKNAVETLLESSENERVFEFHLLYVKQRMRVLDDFFNKLKVETATLSQIAEGSRGIGLSFDVAYLDRLELLKKLFS